MIIVKDSNHCLSVINQPESMCNIVFYHINIMVTNVYIRILRGWGVKCLGENYTATRNTSGSISAKLLTIDPTGRGWDLLVGRESLLSTC